MISTLRISLNNFNAVNFCRNMSAIVHNITKLNGEHVENSDCNKTSNKRPHPEDTETNTQSVEDNCTKIQKTETTEKVKKKNYALMLGYLGRDYYGMQRNPGMKTVEEDLIEALRKANLINQEAFEIIQVINFQRAARTDKGVSAMRQIVSLKLPEYANIEDINRYLPNEIRVFGLKRVTKGFNSKTQCDARTYSYILPTYAFAPEDPTLLPASLDDIDKEKRMEQLSIIDGKPFHEYRISEELLNKVNSTLELFHGTHNFHNFTSKVRPLDPRAKRYIIKFHCPKVFVENDMEFAVLEIKGQSFMLHQIRKMVAAVIMIVRNLVSESIMEEAYGMEKCNLPIAPSLGLHLTHVHYDYYNKRYGSDGIHDTLDWEETKIEVEKFWKAHILKHIAETEISEKTMLEWLSILPQHVLSMKEPIDL